MHMRSRTVAAVVVAVVLALVVPGLGQPFADVPTNHWAYDAIAELAAKGLVEGYPDGTFKGNQPLTRYEMAMIVARIIARIEAIPTPPPPEVRRADLDAVRRDLAAATGRIAVTERTIATLQRLVSEFRAELQALGVRVTALEEKLRDLEARLDNTRITGDLHWRYTTRWGDTVLGTDPSLPFTELTRIRLRYAGTVAPDVSIAMQVGYWSSPVTIVPNVAVPELVNLDRLHLDWRNALGVEGLNVRIGRQVITLGPVGLLLDEARFNDRRDGVSATWKLGAFDLLVGGQWGALEGTPSYSVYSGRLAFSLLPGLGVGLNVRVDHDPIVEENQGSGFSGDVAWDLLAGLKLTGEYATYNAPNALVGPTTRNFWVARLDLNFSQLTGGEIPLNPRVAVWYKNLDALDGTPLAPPATAVEGGEYFTFQDAYYGGFVGIRLSGIQGFGARLDLQLLENLTGFVTYETYDGRATGEIAAPFTNVNVLSVGAAWTIAPRTTVNFFYASLNYSASEAKNQQAAGVYVLTSW